MPFSSGGSLAISATRTTNPYPASRPSTSPASVIRAPVVVGRGVLRHHRAITTSAPRPMRDSTSTGRIIRAIPRPGRSGRADDAAGRGAGCWVGSGPGGGGGAAGNGPVAAGSGPVGADPVRIGPDRRGDRRPGWTDPAGAAGQAGGTGGSGPEGCSGHVPG